MTENSKLGGAPSWNLDPFAGSAGVFNIFLLRFIGGVKARSERKLIDTYLYRRNIIPVFIFASSRSYVRCGSLVLLPMYAVSTILTSSSERLQV